MRQAEYIADVNVCTIFHLLYIWAHPCGHWALLLLVGDNGTTVRTYLKWGILLYCVGRIKSFFFPFLSEPASLADLVADLLVVLNHPQPSFHLAGLLLERTGHREPPCEGGKHTPLVHDVYYQLELLTFLGDAMRLANFAKRRTELQFMAKASLRVKAEQPLEKVRQNASKQVSWHANVKYCVLSKTRYPCHVSSVVEIPRLKISFLEPFLRNGVVNNGLRRVHKSSSGA